MAERCILYFLTILLTQVVSTAATYCYGSYTTYYYSFYCNGQCCGYYTRYCCYTNDVSDAVVVAIILGVMIAFIAIATIILVICKKCNRTPIRPRILVQRTNMTSYPSDNFMITNPQIYKNFELPPYSPQEDPPNYESIFNTTNERPRIINSTTLSGNRHTQDSGPSQDRSHVITSQPPSNHLRIRDSEL